MKTKNIHFENSRQRLNHFGIILMHVYMKEVV